MVGILLVIIYIAFVSLGLPDSLLGAAWPAIYTELELNVSLAGLVTFTTSLCTIVSSLFSARIIKRWGTGVVSAASVMLTAVAMYGFSMADGIGCFILFSVPLGLGAGCIDSALNNYVALHYKATHMNFLHCCYGVGVSVSPYIMSLALEKEKWQTGYVSVAIIQGIIAVTIFITLPLWKKVSALKNLDVDKKAEDDFKIYSFREMLRDKKAVATWIMFFAYCGIECTAGIWGSTYLVLCKDVSMEFAAKCVMIYYGGMAIGRFLCGVFANKISAWKLIYIGYIVLGIALIVLLFPGKSMLSAIALFCIGFGCAPIYPNLMHLTPINFGRDMSQSMMGAQSAAAFTGSTFVPPLFGIIAQNISPDYFSGVLIILDMILRSALIGLIKSINKESEEQNYEGI